MARPKSQQSALTQKRYSLSDLCTYGALAQLGSAEELLNAVCALTTQAMKELSQGHSPNTQLVKHGLKLQDALHEASNAMNILRMQADKALEYA